MVILVVFAFSLTRRSAAQNTTDFPHKLSTVDDRLQTRDPRATAVLNEAIQVLGGIAAMSNMRSWTIHETVHGGISDQSAIAVNAEKGEFSIETTSKAQESATKSGHGRPALTVNGTVLPLLRPTLRPSTDPFSFLEELFRAATSSAMFIAMAETTNSDAVAVDISRKSMQPFRAESPHRWLFDPKNSMPIRLEYGTSPEESTSPFSGLSVTFADYRMVNGLLLPFCYIVNQGKSTEEVVVDSVTFDEPHNSAIFDAKERAK